MKASSGNPTESRPAVLLLVLGLLLGDSVGSSTQGKLWSVVGVGGGGQPGKEGRGEER